VTGRVARGYRIAAIKRSIGMVANVVKLSATA
jgi:hypothetical protein